MRSADASFGMGAALQETGRSSDEWHHEGLAVACCRRFFGRGIPAQELLQEARAAICLAQERFDPERGCRFSTYAVPVVLGALRAYCRRAVPVTVPRRMLEESLLAEAGQTPATPPPAALRITAPADGGNARFAPAVHPTAVNLEDVPEALLATVSFEERLLLRDAVRRLDSPYAQVIGLRYLCGLSQREVGQRLGAAQWQVCRWEKMGLGMLREGLAAGG